MNKKTNFAFLSRALEQYSIFTPALAGILALSFIVQMLYWWLLHARIIYHNAEPSRIRKSPVSIIICARNEAENLRQNLPLVLEQEYPDYEVIVVNDASGDETEEVLRDLKMEYPHLRTSTIEDNQHRGRGKKLALTVGIKAAVNDWILLTDADCRPAGDAWLSSMQQNFRNENEVVLGYGPYIPQRGLLNLLIRYDTFFIALQYMGFALAGIPYMGVGRNLAYRRELFFKNKGFASHYELDSGDDDLFINEVARSGNTGIEIRPEAHTHSESMQHWKAWYYQKKRHLSTGGRYRFKTRFLLGAELLSRYVFYASFTILAAKLILLPYVLGIFFVRMLSTIVIIKLAMRRLNEKYLLLISPILDIILPLAFIYMVFSNYIAQKKERWI